MTKLEDKFWDAAIKEAATGRQPPNQVDQILLRLEIPDLGPPKPETAPKGRVIRLRLFVEVAVAAAALVAIGILTGLIPIGGNEAKNDPTQAPEGQHFAEAPGTKFELKDDRIELRDGWLLVTTGAPEVHCEGSVLNKVDGRVLVHSGSMPTGAQAESVADWLRANELELEMITNPKRWVLGAAMAALVLNGSALLDGNLIEAQGEKKSDAPQWHRIRTVMEVQKLPKEATHVVGWDLEGAYLEFLSEQPQVTHLGYFGARKLRAEYLRKLAKLPNLESLEMSGATWESSADYSPLLDCSSLKSLTVDFIPDDGAGEPLTTQTAEVLKKLSDRGVDLTLTGLDNVSGNQLQWIGSSLTRIKRLDLSNNELIGDADLRTLQNMSSLSYLDLTKCTDIGELGLAYVSKIASLRELRTTADMTEAVTYQLANMNQVETLSVQFHSNSERAKPGLKMLARLPNLIQLRVEAFPDPDAAAEIRNFVNLKSLKLDWTGDWNPDPDGFADDCLRLQVYGAAGVSSIQKNFFDYELRALDDESLSLDRSALNDVKETNALHEATLVFEGNVEESLKDTVDRPIVLEKLSKFKGLKRVHVHYWVTENQSSDAFIKYMKKVLKDYEVDFTLMTDE